MPQSLEERVAYLEGRASDQAQAQNDFRELLLQLNRRVDHLDQKIDRFRDELADRIGALEQSFNERFNALEQRFSVREQSVDARFQSIDARFQSVNDRIDALDAKVSRQFVWLVGIQITVLVAVVSALIAALMQ